MLTLVALDEVMAAMSGQDALTGLASARLFQDRPLHGVDGLPRDGESVGFPLS